MTDRARQGEKQRHGERKMEKNERRQKETNEKDDERDKVFCDLTGPNWNGHACVLK